MIPGATPLYISKDAQLGSGGAVVLSANANVGSKTRSRVSFTSEISRIMFIFGDYQTPRMDTVLVMETSVKRILQNIVRLLEDLESSID